jgi:hypothetical protein
MNTEIIHRLEQSFELEQKLETQEERVLGLATKATTAAIDQAFLKLRLTPEERRRLEPLLNYKMTPADMEPQPISGDPQLPFEDEDQQRPEKHGDRTDAETGR